MLSAIHQPNQPFIQYLFLPVIGSLLVLMGSSLCLVKQKSIRFGHKAIWIPLAIICASIVLRPIYAMVTGQSQWGLSDEWASAGYGLGLFALYLSSRSLGWRVFSVFTPAIIVTSLSTVIFGLSNPGVKTGGIISITNYDITTGFLVFGLMVSCLQHRWWLSAITLVGLFFTGADEAVFVVGVIFLVVLVRKDWSRKLLLPIGALLLVIMLTLPLGIPQKLYYPTYVKLYQARLALTIDNGKQDGMEVAMLAPSMKKGYETTLMTRDELIDEALGYRWLTYWKISPLKPLGYGYNINHFYIGIPHNTNLIIVEQVGVLASVAWLWIVVYGIAKSRWKYIWASVFLLSIFDHFLWTQASFWFWALAGASQMVVSASGSDLIYKQSTTSQTA